MATMAPDLEPATKRDGLAWLQSYCNKAAIEKLVSSFEFVMPSFKASEFVLCGSFRGRG